MNDEGELRFPESHDLPALLELYEHLHAEEARPEADEARRVWRQATASPDIVYVGLFVADKLVSTCNAALVPNLTRGCRPFAVIENVVTDPDYRGRGYARRCLERLRDHCLERGCYKLMLLSGSEREHAHSLYESLGFDSSAKRAFLLRSQP